MRTTFLDLENDHELIHSDLAALYNNLVSLVPAKIVTVDVNNLVVVPGHARPTGTPAAATDLATALTLVNYLRAQLLALGVVA